MRYRVPAPHFTMSNLIERVGSNQQSRQAVSLIHNLKDMTKFWHFYILTFIDVLKEQQNDYVERIEWTLKSQCLIFSSHGYMSMFEGKKNLEFT